MNRFTILKQQIFLAVFVFALSFPLKASHIAGADIAYQQISPMKFKVVYRIYRSCKDVPLSAPDFKVSGANGSNSTTITATRTSIRDISLVCSKDTLPCNPVNTTVSSGMEEHTFETVVDFTQAPFNAIKNANCKVVFSVSTCCRSGAVTNISPGNFYLEAMVDLCLIGNKGNNSPVFRTRPISELCCNTAFMYNNGAFESAEGDSLSFEMITPLKGINDPESYTGNFSESFPMTPYCPPNSGVLNCTPLPNAKPPRGMFFDKVNGDITFTPINCSEVAVMNFKVNEWRKDSSGTWVLIGYVKRESTWYVKSCSNNNPPSFTGNNKFSVCEGNKLCFTIGTIDDPFLPVQTVLDTVSLSWDSSIQAATFRIIDPSAREKSAEFCWQTKVGDARSDAYRTTVRATDDLCGRPLEAYRTFTIQVKPKATDTRTYTTGMKGYVRFEATADGRSSNYTYQYVIRDSTNSGTPLYQTFSRKDSFKFTQIGKYIVEHTINNPPYNCPTIYIDTIRITPAHLVSVPSLTVNDLAMYPNPGNGLVTFESQSMDLNSAYIRVYAIDGKVILESVLQNQSADLRFLSKGIYLIEIKDQNATVIRKLVIE